MGARGILGCEEVQGPEKRRVLLSSRRHNGITVAQSIPASASLALCSLVEATIVVSPPFYGGRMKAPKITAGKGRPRMGDFEAMFLACPGWLPSQSSAQLGLCEDLGSKGSRR